VKGERDSGPELLGGSANESDLFQMWKYSFRVGKRFFGRFIQMQLPKALSFDSLYVPASGQRVELEFQRRRAAQFLIVHLSMVCSFSRRA
jgi:hypothetical protein